MGLLVEMAPRAGGGTDVFVCIGDTNSYPSECCVRLWGHHSWQSCCSVATQTGDEVPATTAASPMVGYVDPAPVSPAPVFEYVAPTPAVTFAAPSPVVRYVAPTPAVTYAALAPVIGYVAPAPSVTSSATAPVFEYVTPAPVFGFIAPAPAGSFVAPSQQLRPAYTDDAAVVVSASQVVGSLPHGDCFLRPCFVKFIMYRLLEVKFLRTWSKSLLSSRGGHHLSSM